MSHIAQKLFCPLYRLEILISEKSNTDKVHRKKIITDLSELLGVTKGHFRKILVCQIGHPGYLSIKQLTDLAEYFSCTLDDLVNKDLQSSDSNSGTKGSACAGDFLTAEDPT
jgi:hypothetical protein